MPYIAAPRAAQALAWLRPSVRRAQRKPPCGNVFLLIYVGSVARCKTTAFAPTLAPKQKSTALGRKMRYIYLLVIIRIFNISDNVILKSVKFCFENLLKSVVCGRIYTIFISGGKPGKSQLSTEENAQKIGRVHIEKRIVSFNK